MRCCQPGTQVLQLWCNMSWWGVQTCAACVVLCVVPVLYHRGTADAASPRKACSADQSQQVQCTRSRDCGMLTGMKPTLL
jgi:hypothetical protein